MTDIFNTENLLVGRVGRLLAFLEYANNFYIAIGKSSPWTNDYGVGINDNNPPKPNINLSNIPETIIYKKVETVIPAVASNTCADINLDSKDFEVLAEGSLVQKTYNFIKPDKIYYSNGELRAYPTHLYISTKVEYTDYDTSSFRAIGFYTSIDLKQGVDRNKLIVLPNEVNKGLIHWASYSTPVERIEGKTHHIEFMMQL